jgi:hypothetical protein
MSRQCDVCGRAYTARRARSRFCGGTCGKRSQRTGPAGIGPRPGVLDDDEAPLSELERAVIRELAEAGHAQSVAGRVAGQVALELAHRIGSGRESDGAVASLVKELRATMAAAQAGRAPAPDLLDELRVRRDRKRGAGA